MPKVLSQEEIDTLLESANEVERASRRSAPRSTVTSAHRYHFRRPDRVSKDQIRSLQFLHDRFARNVATSLSAYLRTPTSVSVRSVETFTYGEFLSSLPDPTLFYALSLAPIDLVGALELNPEVAFAVVDRLLGGTGNALPMDRPLTEIEQNVVDAAITFITNNLVEAWQPIVDIGFNISGRETRPQMLQVATPNEQMIVVACEMKVAEAVGSLHITLPTGLIELVGSKFSATWQRSHRKPTDEETLRLRDRLASVPFPVAGLLQTQLPVRELIALRPGDTVTFGQSIEQPVDVSVDGNVKFKAQLVRCGHRAGLKVERFEQASSLAESA